MTGLIPSRTRNIAIAEPPGPPPIISTSVFIIYFKLQSTECVEFVSHLYAVNLARVLSRGFLDEKWTKFVTKLLLHLLVSWSPNEYFLTEGDLGRINVPQLS